MTTYQILQIVIPAVLAIVASIFFPILFKVILPKRKKSFEKLPLYFCSLNKIKGFKRSEKIKLASWYVFYLNNELSELKKNFEKAALLNESTAFFYTSYLHDDVHDEKISDMFKIEVLLNNICHIINLTISMHSLAAQQLLLSQQYDSDDLESIALFGFSGIEDIKEFKYVLESIIKYYQRLAKKDEKFILKLAKGFSGLAFLQKLYRKEVDNHEITKHCFLAAIQAFEKLLADPESKSLILNTQLNYAVFLKEIKDYESSRVVLEEALRTCRIFAIADIKYVYTEALILSEIAFLLHLDNNNKIEFYEYCKKATQAFKKSFYSKDGNKLKNLREIVVLCYFLAQAYVSEGSDEALSNAIKCYDEVILMCQGSKDNNIIIMLPELLETQANVYLSKQAKSYAIALYKEALYSYSKILKESIFKEILLEKQAELCENFDDSEMRTLELYAVDLQIKNIEKSFIDKTQALIDKIKTLDA